jgi:glutathione synthase/RimK-type ligase-like ATP-grasp enzyme
LSDRRPRVAFTAPPQFPDLHDDWPLVRAALDDTGLDALPVVWSDPSVDWSSFDLIVANGAWDNIHHVDEFLAWVHARDRGGVPTVNSPDILRWNLDKCYLRALEAAGVATVPTTWVEPRGGADANVEAEAVIDQALARGEVVVKPSISGGGYQTARYEPHGHAEAVAHVRALLELGRTAMVQPYQSAVDRDGEIGLVFLGGEFSHAIHKDPMIRRREGPTAHLIDNQVVTSATATPAHLALGRQAVAAAAHLLGPTTYARVDTVPGEDGRPMLLELELLDPVLFFTTEPAGAARFARVLAEHLGAA